MNAKLSRDNASLNQRIPMPTRYCVRTIAELFSRPIVGWSMQCICGSVVTDALPVATFRCRLAPGLIFRPDRPGQYCRHSFQDGLTEYDVAAGANMHEFGRFEIADGFSGRTSRFRVFFGVNAVTRQIST